MIETRLTRDKNGELIAEKVDTAAPRPSLLDRIPVMPRPDFDLTQPNSD